MTTAKARYRAECAPERVAAELDRLWSQHRRYPSSADAAALAWPVIVEWDRWRIGWHLAFQRQWSLLGEWARATGQPRAVQRAIWTAEHEASTAAIRAEADLVESERHAARATARDAGAVA